MLHTSPMTIRVVREPSGWRIHAEPPSVSTDRDALVATPTEVLAALSLWGCQSTDSTDALDASGTEWRTQHDREVQQRRGM